MVSKFRYVPILFILIIAQSCHKSSISKKNALFQKHMEKEAGIHFSNAITESDTFNYFTFPYLYLGGGVAIGDLNNDGLSDIYFTGNMVSNKLYINLGNLQFKDITLESGTSGDHRWYTGVTMTDINNDGWLDIYLSVSGKDGNTSNQLFVNNGDLTFADKASQYGIADHGNSIQSTFFDYDNDGLQDLFVANYPIISLSMGNQYYHNKMVENDPVNSGHLYRNTGDGHFEDVTEQAGVQNYGLTLGLVASDLNNDGWKDLYLSNDFNVPDYLYINNQDGTFSEAIKKASGHTSFFGMGIDAADFNNDGWIDLIQSEMNPEDYKRSKKNMASMNPASFQERRELGFHHQYMQNSLQLNNGNQNDIPVFSEISRYAKMAATDWSWACLFADFDNDGLKDVYISNGMKRDVNDNDIRLMSERRAVFNDTQVPMSEYPSVPIDNYAYHNTGGVHFEEVTQEWGLDYKGFTHGVAYGDLDNDGDLDLVLNNLDDTALIFENVIQNRNYLRVQLKGPENNPLGLGALVEIHTKNRVQTQELTLTRGYQSSMEPILHFGLGNFTEIDSMRIIWPDQKTSVQGAVTANQTVQVSYASSLDPTIKAKPKREFQEISDQSKIAFKHHEDNYDDYLYEPLLPHRNSRYGPGLAVGDVNNDGLDDFYVGNAAGQEAALFIQKENGTYEELVGPWKDDSAHEDTGAVFGDFDNNGTLDLYVASGGNDPNANYGDRLYLQTEQGYIKTENILPRATNSGLAIAPMDYDGDGDLDLFVGGRVLPGKYPFAPQSYLLQNELEKGHLKFTDVTQKVFPELTKLGLVTNALWQDMDGDNLPDLLVTGEWMPIRLFKNSGHSFKEITGQAGLAETQGWWYALETLDVDQDGDMDLIGGNLGLNYKYKATAKEPFQIYANDFDANGKSDIVLSYKKKGIQLPVRGRECSSQQVPAIAARFKTYEAFADANLVDIYGSAMLKNSLNYEVRSFAHYWFENKGQGHFIKHKLPEKAQLSAITSIVPFDYNGDAYPDLLVAGNLYNSEVETPRNDSGVGLILQNIKGKGFKAIPPAQSGLMVRGDVRSVRPISSQNDSLKKFLFGINNDSLRLLEFKRKDI